jgi:hypothetical protein
MSWARRICAEFCDPMPTSERIGHWIRMRRFLGRFSEPGWSVHAPCWADFITATPAFKVFGTNNRLKSDRAQLFHEFQLGDAVP